MLVITRRPNEEVLIGDNVRLIVGQIDRNQVRLVFDGPPEVRILRRELVERQCLAAAPGGNGRREARE
jgi:carbon storage regulator CsrA